MVGGETRQERACMMYDVFERTVRISLGTPYYVAGLDYVEVDHVGQTLITALGYGGPEHLLSFCPIDSHPLPSSMIHHHSGRFGIYLMLDRSMHASV